MSNRIPETIVKVSGQREKVEIVLDKICDLFRCTVSPIREGNYNDCHVYLTIVEDVVE